MSFKMSKKSGVSNDWEEDYVTRCICGFTHDDGFMICCDDCSVWQHIECVQVDPNNLPDNYLCEQCSPRTVDKKKAKTLQMRKRDELASTNDGDEHRKGKPPLSPPPAPGVAVGSWASRKRKKISSKPPPLAPRVGRARRQGEGLELRSSPSPQPAPKESRKRSREDPQKPRRPPQRGGPPDHRERGGSPPAEEVDSVWSCHGSPWSEPYEVVAVSRTSQQLRALVRLKMAAVRCQATLLDQASLSAKEHRQPKCVVVDIQKHRKGVISEVPIDEGALVMLFKGKYTLRHVVAAELAAPGAFLWKERPCPFIYYYDNIPGVDLVVDARHQGNIARFARRSCTPSCELQHILLEQEELCLGVYSSRRINSGEEITLPFDFTHTACDYPIECACGQENCLLEAGQGAGSGGGLVAEGPVVERPAERNVGLGKKRMPDRDSSVRLSGDTPAQNKKRRRTTSSLNSPGIPLSTVPAEEVEAEDTEGERASKKKSREERKLEAYVRMINSMEAQTSSRRRPDRREEELDLARHGRKRVARTPLLSVDDSVSMEQPLSPLEGDVSSPLYSMGMDMLTPSLHLSPPPSPPSRPKPKMPFSVGPWTDPGYLFNSFPSPTKKALLKRWRGESTQIHRPATSAPEPRSAAGTVPVKKRLIRRFYQHLVSAGEVAISSLPVKLRTARKWEAGRTADREANSSRQSPLFEDFSDDEDFDCLSEAKSLSRGEHRLSSGSFSNLTSKLPASPPLYSPRPPSLASPVSVTSPRPLGGESPIATTTTAYAPLEKQELMMDNDGTCCHDNRISSGYRASPPPPDELSRESGPAPSLPDQCASPSEPDTSASCLAPQGRRKVSLKEYLSRTKKASESRKPSVDLTEGALHPSLSLLSKALTSFASTLPSLDKKPSPSAGPGSLLLDSRCTPEQNSPSPGLPEFEPVSPDGEDAGKG